MDSLQLNIELGERQYGNLPGPIQQWLKEHEMTGTLQVAASGRLPLGDAGAGDLAAMLTMEKLHFVAGEYKGEAEKVSGKLSIKDRRLVLDPLDADTLKGKIHLAADIALADPFDGRIHLTAKDILLEETLRASAGGGGGDPKYKGAVNTEVTLTGPMNKILTRAGGGGSLTLRNGRLVRLRLIADIGQALAQKINSILSIEKQRPADTDSADLEFQFIGDKVHFTKIFAQTPTFAVNGYGDIGFDKRLDLMLNGGPIEKLQSVMDTDRGSGGSGNQVVDAVGNVLHAVGRGATDLAAGVASQVATILVSGTTDEPKVSVEPFRKVRDMLGGK
jgi:hypothetical protein